MFEKSDSHETASSTRHPFLHRQSGGQKGQFKSAKETWGYKNITSFKNTIAESFRVSFLSTADKQSEQFGNKDTRLGSGIEDHHSNQLKKKKNPKQTRSRLALRKTSCSRD